MRLRRHRSRRPTTELGVVMGEARRAQIERLASELEAARHPILTTHINADGDGAGSEVALALYLKRRGVEATIVNPTAFPATYTFLMEGIPVWTLKAEEGREALDQGDLFVVVDTSEPSRLGDLYPAMRGRRVAVIDHHPETPLSIGDTVLRDVEACAAGELVYDLVKAAAGDLPQREAEAIYVAIATDTGSFRFANTNARTHEICADLLRAGVDPELMYRRLYGQVTGSHLELLRRALAGLERDPQWPLAWITLRSEDFQESGASSSDLEGIVEHARQLRGVEVAALFRELADRSTKVSLRSNGDVDVAAIARRHGGGGHEKAAGAHIKAALEGSRAEVLASVRQALRKRGWEPTYGEGDDAGTP